MNLLESYALSCGLKISEPFITEKYYPLPFDKYITIHPSSGAESRQYSFWQDVVDFISEKIQLPMVQVGGEEDKLLGNCYNLLGKDLNKTAYVLKRSSLHLGNDTFSSHMCGYFGTPMVILYGATTIKNHGPFFKNGRQYLIESNRNGKNPSFTNTEEEKSVDLIPIENILDSISKEFPNSNIPKIETLHIGDLYNSQVVEFIPNFKLQHIKSGIINIRMDYYFDETNLAESLKIHKGHIISDKPIDVNLIYIFKKNIQLITFVINDYNFEEDYLNIIKNSGVKLQLLYDGNDEEELSKLRFKYFDFEVMHEPKKTLKDVDFLDKVNTMTYYKSKKIIFSNGKAFLSKKDMQENIPAEENSNYITKVNSINDAFAEELDFFLIFNQKK